jgi:MFS family permease
MNLANGTPVELQKVYRSNTIAVIFENALYSLVRLAVSPYLLLPFYLKQLTSSSFLIGLITAVCVLGFAVPQLLMARIIQRTRNRKRLLVLSAVAQRLFILALLVLTIIQVRFPKTLTIILFFIIYLLFNLARGCYSPTQVDFLSRALPSNNRGKILGISFFFGGFLALLSTMLLTRLLSVLPYPQSITAAVAISFCGSVISFFAVLRYQDVLPAQPVDAPAAAPALPGRSWNLPSLDFRRYLGWRAVIIGLEMMLPFYILYGLDKFNLPAAYVGIFASILTISDAICNPLWGMLGDKIGYQRVIIAASLLGCVGAAFAAFSPNVFLFSFVFLFNGMAQSGQLLGAVTIIYEFSPREDVPIYTAFQQVILSILSGIAPVAGGAIAAAIGYASGSMLSGSIGLVGTIGMLLSRSGSFRERILHARSVRNLDI